MDVGEAGTYKNYLGRLSRMRVGVNKYKYWLIKKGYSRFYGEKKNFSEIIGGCWFKCLYFEKNIFDLMKDKKFKACDWNLGQRVFSRI